MIYFFTYDIKVIGHHHIFTLCVHLIEHNSNKSIPKPYETSIGWHFTFLGCIIHIQSIKTKKLKCVVLVAVSCVQILFHSFLFDRLKIDRAHHKMFYIFIFIGVLVYCWPRFFDYFYSSMRRKIKKRRSNWSFCLFCVLFYITYLDCLLRSFFFLT